MAFPIIFPYGDQGISHKRNKFVYPAEFLKHCYHYHDRRFLTHKIFLYWAFN